jgi:methyl-accepting chemotaxis protein
MGTVFARLEAQVNGLASTLHSFQQSSAERVEATREQIAKAQGEAAAMIASTGSKAAEALQAGLAQALERISSEFERFEGAMRSGATAYMQQAGAMGDATNQTRQAADAFAQVAGTVRSSSTPLLQSSERIAQATAELNAATRNALAEMERLSTGAGQVAARLQHEAERMAANWALHSERFEGADRSLAGAVATLGKATDDQTVALNRMVGEIDLELTKVLDRLRHTVGSLGEHTGELTDSVSALVRLQHAAE